MRKPFDENNGPHVEGLRDWLRENALPETRIGGDYTVADLISDLEKILEDEWSRGIDARGEDS